MKVLDLQCRQGHVFEGWFASEDDFQGQKQRGLVQCPLCADDHIEKRLSAPRLNLGAREPAAPSAMPTPSAAPEGGSLQVGNPPALPPHYRLLGWTLPARSSRIPRMWVRALRRRLGAYTTVRCRSARFAGRPLRMRRWSCWRRASSSCPCLCPPPPRKRSSRPSMLGANIFNVLGYWRLMGKTVLLSI